jgi:hypothetical protein
VRCGDCKFWTRHDDVRVGSELVIVDGKVRWTGGTTRPSDLGVCGKITDGTGEHADENTTIEIEGYGWDSAVLDSHEDFGCVLFEAR